MNASLAQNDMRRHILETARPIIGGRGFSAVGLNEILGAARVPKGSFYHYFASKEAFGEALLEQYFAAYLARIDTLFAEPGLNAAERFMKYWTAWRDRHIAGEVHDHCLAVKLGAEVCDLSERMRVILQEGTAGVVEKLSRFITAAKQDGSLTIHQDARSLAMALYQLWLGATLLAKFTRDSQPFDEAMTTTRQMLNLSG
ncbi:TetR/AcrR family transcriptional regulator [Gluconacetobacter azotocaptans]|uniref:TetR/AcrR family transcriptional regulator n=1 Tax=Gluconacetobacter azotocaptans TaxID=142834 RepID=A0A7W4JPE4_9PROT|nr:TetR/AcrR family transcriptional regulator [Gluconacetobacter azotocaptans]MBB2188447.1 TetR/AcrR family transcriptional regulator [Gluconacetobacter azotocaptans]MBM9400160.1 TetR/AcrR family transcriptional regulator [Gluconacetobacter azotocaptans]GBQ27866.1 TetR family transcriptional regulator [Gluconacetobacter azotocaptans DSM 13594]